MRSSIGREREREEKEEEEEWYLLDGQLHTRSDCGGGAALPKFSSIDCGWVATWKLEVIEI